MITLVFGTRLQRLYRLLFHKMTKFTQAGFVGEVYCRTNTVNKNVYIGQSTREGDIRWSECLSAARQGEGYRLGAALRKYGEEVFERKTIYFAKSYRELDMMERFFIILHQSHIHGYNVTLGGSGRTSPVSEQAKQHLRNINLGKYKGIKRSAEFCRKQHFCKLGHVITQETKDKIRKTLLDKRANGELAYVDKRSRIANCRSKRNVRAPQIRVCYHCFRAFSIPFIVDRVFCSQACSIANWKTLGVKNASI